MIDNIKRILEGSKEINEWKIVENKISSKEVFFIKDKIQMNRGKDVLHYKVTLYRDFEEDNKKIQRFFHNQYPSHNEHGRNKKLYR
jgi:hypothetical protein